MRLRSRVLLTVFVALTILVAAPTCGGGKKSSISDEDQGKLTNAYSAVTNYCVEQIRAEGLGQGTGGELGKVAEAVDTAVAAYKDHEPDAEVQFTPAAPKRTLRQYMRSLQTQLGTGDCAPNQAQKIDKALAGD